MDEKGVSPSASNNNEESEGTGSVARNVVARYGRRDSRPPQEAPAPTETDSDALRILSLALLAQATRCQTLA